jgi:hypothetical protein
MPPWGPNAKRAALVNGNQTKATAAKQLRIRTTEHVQGIAWTALLSRPTKATGRRSADKNVKSV